MKPPPFKDGDHVQVVAEPAGTDFFTGFAVLEPDEKSSSFILMYQLAGVRIGVMS
ncbi:hypothetical protein [Xanthomonas oryzae]|uniref:hypothetical protein n=1 Tax=Xanthomonas oryzae TaxID=347 RepID=UPI001404EDF3|nr:hypothetical protein [Xanthomonas oryzae]